MIQLRHYISNVKNPSHAKSFICSFFFGNCTDDFSSRGRVIFITRKIQQHREGEGTCIAREKVDSREAVFLCPGFNFATVYRRCVHTRVWWNRRYTVNFRVYTYIYICSRPKSFHNACYLPIQNYPKAIINYCLSIRFFKLYKQKIAIKEALLLQKYHIRRINCKIFFII